MVLKKPYKFLIKYFRLIHLFLVVFSAYLIYKTNAILNFFNEYLKSSSLISISDLTNQLFNSLMFLIPIIVIITLGIIIYLLKFKEKPIKYYIFNIIIYSIILIYYACIYSVCKTLEIGVIDIRTLKAISDITLILFIFQSIGMIFFIVRALGFDIKKFNFGKDLELDISEKDNEEFEFDITFDSNKAKRNLKNKIRKAKYTYHENKFIINIFIIIISLIIGLIIYLNYNVFNKVYKKGDSFNTNGISIKINESYITNKDNKNNQITDNELIIVKISTKNLTTNDQLLSSSNFFLKINNVSFNHINKYSDNLLDIGTTYKNQKLSTKDYTDYLLVFEVPKKYANKKMILKYKNSNTEDINIQINPKKLLKKETKEAFLGNELNIKNDLVNLGITINDIKIDDTMYVDYQFKTGNIIYDSYEYIVPSYTDNYEKVLMKLEGNIKLKDTTNKNIKNLYDLLYYFGKIEYQINGQTKVMDKTIREVKPKKVKNDDTYIEVYKEIKKADSITLIFEIRENVYKYKIK